MTDLAQGASVSSCYVFRSLCQNSNILLNGNRYAGFVLLKNYKLNIHHTLDPRFGVLSFRQILHVHLEETILDHWRGHIARVSKSSQDVNGGAFSATKSTFAQLAGRVVDEE
jgi:hypothetical protein